MLQRYSPFLSPALAFVFVGTLFSLFWAYSATEERALLEIQKRYFQSLKPDNPEYRTFHKNYQSFYREEKEEQRERLRQIQKQMESDPQEYILKRTLATYHAWLKTVLEKKGDIYQAKTIDERLEVIRAVKENQDRIQGISERRRTRGTSETVNLYPTIYELAEYLEFLESDKPARLETLLGHPPNDFLYQLRQDYLADVE